ncbi:bolA-like protein 3 [Limulus polyphemus]|uniref:BolA-like protein 3 n=1 Tax=Limulus polyphemus TaxID=6850 RepID=A0ABM1BVA3_LIMPO|nr:bolA-like protein 3 [Limulus polyphemus]
MSRFLTRFLQNNYFRYFSDKTTLTKGEEEIIRILKTKFPKASLVKVSDISGGCGAMYEVNLESTDFIGKNRVQQHMMVNEALKEEIKDMHGLRIFTSVPSDTQS